MVKGNTLASFDAALDLGVDMIEFDVCAVRGRLGIAHNPLEGRLFGCVPLETGLAHLALARFGGVELNVDLKQVGVEAGALEALQRHDLLERSLISSHLPAVLDRVRALEPSARTGLSVGARAAAEVRDWSRRIADGPGVRSLPGADGAPPPGRPRARRARPRTRAPSSTCGRSTRAR